MNNPEAIKKLEAYLECKTRESKGVFEECNTDMCDNCDLCYAQGNVGEHKESIRLAIEALKKDWISSEERVPDDANDVICTDGKDMFFAWYSKNLNGWFCYFNKKTVTHWMPLPELPKKE